MVSLSYRLLVEYRAAAKPHFNDRGVVTVASRFYGWNYKAPHNYI